MAYARRLFYRLTAARLANTQVESDYLIRHGWVSGDAVGSAGGGAVSEYDIPETIARQADVDAALALLQDKATAATDAELSAAVATINSAMAGKQAAATAATDAELAAAVATLQDAATAATDAELSLAVANANALISTKQDAATAATDAELAAAVATLNAAIANVQGGTGGITQAQLDSAVATLNNSIALKQDAATAATDAELAAAINTLQDKATAATDAELSAAVSNLTSAIGLKQDAATAATDAELAAAVAGLHQLGGFVDPPSSNGGGQGTTLFQGGNLNSNLRSGVYNGDNLVNGPSGIGTGWAFLFVYAHPFTTNWQRQIVWDMSGTQDRAWTRTCRGGDATTPGAWSAWVQIAPPAPLTIPMHFAGTITAGVKTVKWLANSACTLTLGRAVLESGSGVTWRVIVRDAAGTLVTTGATSAAVGTAVTLHDFTDIAVPAGGRVQVEIVNAGTAASELSVTLTGTVP